MTRIGVVDTTFRDAQQCLWATRMTTPMMLPVAERLDQAGFDVIEVVGAVQFDACVRYLGENPWERLRLLRERIRRTPMQALFRSKCVLGFDMVPDDLSELWAERLFASGITHFVAFDGLHDLGNIAPAIRHVRNLGGRVTGWLTYSLSPVHTDELFAAKAREFIDDVGIDNLMIEDTGGILTPERAQTLVPAIKAEMGDMPFGLHSHGLIGLCQRTYLEAVEKGVDHVYTSIPPLADGNAPPSVVTTARNLRYAGYDIEVDDQRIEEISSFLDRVTEAADKPRGAPRDFDASFMGHQIPGGVHSNLKAQLEAAGLADKLPAVLEESTRVIADLGYPIQVTPFAQLIGVQATLNVVRGERYDIVPLEVKKYALGYYGNLLAPVAPDVLDRIVERGPKDLPLTPPVLEPVVANLRKQYPELSDDERLLRYFFDKDLVDSAIASPIDTEVYSVTETPLLHLLRELTKRPRETMVTVEKPGFRITYSS
ncbi:MAG: pyruvate carboxylase subunit B [Hyphomicrobiaceae bacterium]